MVSITLEGGGKLVEQALLRPGCVRMEVGHLTPDQETKTIGPVQPARIFDFLVLAGPVETERLRELNVPPQVSIRAGRVPPAGKIALVENQALDKRLAV